MHLVRCAFLTQGLKDFGFIARFSCGITNSLIVRQWRHKSHRKQTRIWTRIREWKKESAWMHLSYDLGFDEKKILKFYQCNPSKVKLGNASLFPGNSSVSITQNTGTWRVDPGCLRRSRVNHSLCCFPALRHFPHVGDTCFWSTLAFSYLTNKFFHRDKGKQFRLVKRRRSLSCKG